MVNFYFKWLDDYLSWKDMENAAYYKNYSVQLPVRLIWFPAITLVNSASSGGRVDLPDGAVVDVAQDGTVAAQLYIQLVAACDMNLFSFEIFKIIIQFLL